MSGDSKDTDYSKKYAYGGEAEKLASMGRYGDSMLLHVNPLEVEYLERNFPGSVTINPETGQPEAFLQFLIPLFAAIAGGIGSIGAVAAPVIGALGTAAGAIGSGIGALGGMAATGLGAAGTAIGSGLGAVGGALGTAGSAIGSGLGSVGSAVGSGLSTAAGLFGGGAEVGAVVPGAEAASLVGPGAFQPSSLIFPELGGVGSGNMMAGMPVGELSASVSSIPLPQVGFAPGSAFGTPGSGLIPSAEIFSGIPGDTMGGLGHATMQPSNYASVGPQQSGTGFEGMLGEFQTPMEGGINTIQNPYASVQNTAPVRGAEAFGSPESSVFMNEGASSVSGQMDPVSALSVENLMDPEGGGGITDWIKNNKMSTAFMGMGLLDMMMRGDGGEEDPRRDPEGGVAWEDGEEPYWMDWAQRSPVGPSPDWFAPGGGGTYGHQWDYYA
mgnify:CR=1 FL=1